MKKKVLSILSVLMAAAMLFSALPLTAYAAQADAADIGATDKTVTTMADLKTYLESSGDYNLTIGADISYAIGSEGHHDNYVPVVCNVASGNKKLDLNGHEITVKNYYRVTDNYSTDHAIRTHSHSTLFNIPSGASLYVTDSKHYTCCFHNLDSDGECQGGCGTISYDGYIWRSRKNIDSRDIFTVNGGRLEVDAGNFEINHSEAVTTALGKSARATIHGSAVLMFSGTTLINGGYFEGMGAYIKEDSNSTYYTGMWNAPVYCEGGKLTIQDGCFKAWNNANGINCVDADEAIILGGTYRYQAAQNITVDALNIVSKQGKFYAYSSHLKKYNRTKITRNGSEVTDITTLNDLQGGTLVFSPKENMSITIGNGLEASYAASSAPGKTQADPIDWDADGTNANALSVPVEVWQDALYYYDNINRVYGSGTSDPYRFKREYTLFEHWTDVSTGTEVCSRSYYMTNNNPVTNSNFAHGYGSFTRVNGFTHRYYPNSTVEAGGTFKVSYSLKEKWNGFSDAHTVDTNLGKASIYVKVRKASDRISSVNAKVTAPTAGEWPSSYAEVVGNDDVFQQGAVWYLNGTSTKIEAPAEFQNGQKYDVVVSFATWGNFVFTNTTQFKINGVNASIVSVDGSTAKAKATFTAAVDADTVLFAPATVTTPVQGETPNRTATTDDSRFTVSAADGWYISGTTERINAPSTFVTNKKYYVVVTYNTTGSYKFLEDTTEFFINGKKAEVTSFSTHQVKAVANFTCADNPYLISAANATVTEPAQGDWPYSLATPTGEYYMTNTPVKWYLSGTSTEITAPTEFESGKSYDAVVTYTTGGAYKFASDAKFSINERFATVISFSQTSVQAKVTFTVAGEIQTINRVNVTGIVDPVVGAAPSSAVTQDSATPYKLSDVKWYNVTDGRDMASTEKFQAGKVYRVSVLAATKNNYRFASGMTAKVNGNTASVTQVAGYEWVRNVIEYTYPALEANEVIGTATATVTVPEAGAHPSPYAISGDSDKYTVGIEWYLCDSQRDIVSSISTADTFESGNTYGILIRYTPNSGYQFDSNTKYLINGEEVSRYFTTDMYFMYFDVEDNKYNLWVGDTQVTEANKDDILGGGSGISFDPATSTLTLDDFARIDGFYDDGANTCKIYAGSIDLTVKGSIWMNSSDCGDIGICVANGNLTFDCDYCYFYGKKVGVSTSGNVTVNGGRVGGWALSGGISGIHANKLIINSGAESVYAECYGANAAIDCNSSITVDPAIALVTPAGGDVYGNTVWTSSAHSEEAHEVLWEKPAGPATQISKVELMIDNMGQPFKMPEDGLSVYNLMLQSQTEGIMPGQANFYDENDNWVETFEAGHTYTVKIDFQKSIDGNYEMAPDFTVTVNGKTATVEKMGDDEMPMYKAVYTYPVTPAADVVIDQVDITDMWELTAGGFFVDYAEITEGCTIKEAKLYASEGDALYDEGALADDYRLEEGSYWAAFTVKAKNGYVFALGEDNAPRVTGTVMGTRATVRDALPNPTDKYIRVIAKLECKAPAGYSVNIIVQSYLSETDEVTAVMKNKETGDEYSMSEPCPNLFSNISISFVPNGDYTLTLSKKNHVSRDYDVTVNGDHVNIADAKICPIGDATNDGKVNMFDYNAVYKHVARTNELAEGSYQRACADATGDGKVNMFDYNAIYKHVARTKPLF